MTAPNAPGSSRADRIRRAFDASFAEPEAPPRAATVRLLLVQVGDTPCAIPLGDCAGVAAAGGITTLPARHPAFVGLAAVAGLAVPVYDLATYVGFLPAADAPWLLVAAGAHALAFRVTAIEGYSEADPSLTAGGHDAVVAIDGVPRHIIRLATVADAIARDATLSPRS